METKQTAVEWLENNFSYVTSGNMTMEYLIEKAKEIEKQQIIEAYDIGFIYPIKFDFKNNKSQDAEQYYNETFNK
jgi:hypothetical protein